MKVLIINKSDLHGGAARAAFRLHTGLIKQGVECKMLVLSKSSKLTSVLEHKTELNRYLAKVKPKIVAFLISKIFKPSSLFSVPWFGSYKLYKVINEIKPDIVHLHWINGGLLKVKDLKRINAPIVWSLHDMWPFTDGYHYDAKFDYEKNYKEEKPLCIQSIVFELKKRTYQNIKNLYVVGLSTWINNCSQRSRLFHDKIHYQIPNLIDIKNFKPLDKSIARKALGIAKGKKIIIYGAMGADDRRKGASILVKALKHVKSDFELIVFGGSSILFESINKKVHEFGAIKDDSELIALYSAGDMLVSPSLQENLSNIIMESMSCGLPVAAFRIGGNSDLIDHKLNGYLAKPFDEKELATGIDYLLDESKRMSFYEHAQRKIGYTFNEDLISKKYITMYKEVLKNTKKN